MNKKSSNISISSTAKINFNSFTCDHPLNSIKMRPIAQAAKSAAKQWTKNAIPKSRFTAVEPQKRLATTSTGSSTAAPSSFDSPFESKQTAWDSNKVPSFKGYLSKSNETSNRVFQYFMVGSMGLLTAAGAKATVQGESISMVKTMSDRIEEQG